MFSSLFGIKSISSIQNEATKEIRKSVTAQLAVEKKARAAAQKALDRSNAAGKEARKGTAFIQNFNALFTPVETYVGGDDTEEHS